MEKGSEPGPPGNSAAVPVSEKGPVLSEKVRDTRIGAPDLAARNAKACGISRVSTKVADWIPPPPGKAREKVPPSVPAPTPATESWAFGEERVPAGVAVRLTRQMMVTLDVPCNPIAAWFGVGSTVMITCAWAVDAPQVTQRTVTSKATKATIDLIITRTLNNSPAATAGAW
ncbi:hypothetical protein [Pelagibius sp.]|uniref:hypothetical protein n=1 Tax=Pelagibius sp. TaxID=1931238 RepID=UPI00260BDF77|nr:hypothetical protein [Pelagibius sp.]